MARSAGRDDGELERSTRRDGLAVDPEWDKHNAIGRRVDFHAEVGRVLYHATRGVGVLARFGRRDKHVHLQGGCGRACSESALGRVETHIQNGGVVMCFQRVGGNGLQVWTQPGGKGGHRLVVSIQGVGGERLGWQRGRVSRLKDVEECERGEGEEEKEEEGGGEVR